MTRVIDWKKFKHLPEDMAKSLAKAQTEVYQEHPELDCFSLKIHDDCVVMNPFTAFELLQEHNEVLWESVLDAFVEIAQEKFLEHHKIDPDSDHDYYLENGCDFNDTSIIVLR